HVSAAFTRKPLVGSKGVLCPLGTFSPFCPRGAARVTDVQGICCYLCRRYQPREKLDGRRWANRFSCYLNVSKFLGRPRKLSKRGQLIQTIGEDAAKPRRKRGAA